jgi:hypothetical protein
MLNQIQNKLDRILEGESRMNQEEQAAFDAAEAKADQVLAAISALSSAFTAEKAQLDALLAAPNADAASVIEAARALTAKLDVGIKAAQDALNPPVPVPAPVDAPPAT